MQEEEMAARWGLISCRLSEFCIRFCARCISICWNWREKWRKNNKTLLQEHHWVHMQRWYKARQTTATCSFHSLYLSLSCTSNNSKPISYIHIILYPTLGSSLSYTSWYFQRIINLNCGTTLELWITTQLFDFKSIWDGPIKELDCNRPFGRMSNHPAMILVPLAWNKRTTTISTLLDTKSGP